jgi:hypothetical protein
LFFPPKHHPWFPGFSLSTGSAFILPVQVKSGSDKNAETENENQRSNSVFQYLTKNERQKTEMTI